MDSAVNLKNTANIAELDTDALWEAMVAKLAGEVKTRISLPKGRPYFTIASAKHKSLISYLGVYSVRGKSASVGFETYCAEEGKAAIESMIATAPEGHIIKSIEAKQGAKNKDKWCWMVETSNDKSLEELAQWYADLILEFYRFFESIETSSSVSAPTSVVERVEDEDVEEYVEPNVEASAAELASARVKVYGKAQNRTVLGIAHAYMIMYPHATLADLCKAFPASALNPAVKELFVDVTSVDSGDKAQLAGSFVREDELIKTGDGKKVALVMMWTRTNFEKIAAHAKQYGILVADFEKAPGGAKKGEFRLEYLNGYIPPVPPAQKKSKAGLWAGLAALLLVLAGLLAYLFAPKPEPQVIEKVVTVVDTVYVQQLEQIEKNFNAAEFVQGKSDLSEDAKFVLHDLAKMMQKHPQIKLQLVGHTSAEGDAALNQKLSEARAQAAVEFLISHGGIDASRLQAVCKGSSELKNAEDPYAPENRRTEFIVVE